VSSIIDISDKSCKQDFINSLQRAVQSAHLNFLFGSGCSMPAISTLGNIENKIQSLIKNGNLSQAKNMLKDFLLPFHDNLKRITTSTLNYNDEKTIANYGNFIKTIAKILYERKNNLLRKQATVFTTNYDLYFELAFKSYSEMLILFDGFKKVSSFDKKLIFSVTEYFNTIFNNGIIYNYQVEVPSLNLIKLHGSLDWTIEDNQLINSLDYIQTLDSKFKSNDEDDIDDFINAFTLILPQKDKFKETLLNQTYYDQLRILSNELDKENVLLIVQGFSFYDEHIYALIKRALRNPTLKMIVFCFDIESKTAIQKLFHDNPNVELIYDKEGMVEFNALGDIMSEVLPLYLKKQDNQGAST